MSNNLNDIQVSEIFGIEVCWILLYSIRESSQSFIQIIGWYFMFAKYIIVVYQTTHLMPFLKHTTNIVMQILRCLLRLAVEIKMNCGNFVSGSPSRHILNSVVIGSFLRAYHFWAARSGFGTLKVENNKQIKSQFYIVTKAYLSWYMQIRDLFV